MRLDSKRLNIETLANNQVRPQPPSAAWPDFFGAKVFETFKLLFLGGVYSIFQTTSGETV